MWFCSSLLLLVVTNASGSWSSTDSDDLTYTFDKTYYNAASLTWSSSDTSSYCHVHAEGYIDFILVALPSGNVLKSTTLYYLSAKKHYLADVISTITFWESQLSGLRLYTNYPQNQAFHSVRDGYISVTEQVTGSPTRYPTTAIPSQSPTATPTTNPTVNPTSHPTVIPTWYPTTIPTLSPTRFCHAARCYGSGAFGANCSGPADKIDHPITLTKSSNSIWAGSNKPEGHIEIFPSFSIDLQRSTRVRFDTKITDISTGINLGAVFAVSVKYGGCKSAHTQLFSLTQPMWAATSCDDTQWHSWEVLIHFDTIEVSCDGVVVWNHARTDMQDSWEVGEVAPFLALGAYYSPKHNSWQSHSDMVIWNVDILSCESETPTSMPSKSPTESPVEAPTQSPTTPSPTQLPTELPTVYPSAGPTKTPTLSPTVAPTFSPSFSCDVLTAGCYGQDAFGAQCDGPTTEIGFPITLEKATTSLQIEQKGVCGSHIEVYPAKSIDLTSGTKIQFHAQIFDITGGNDYGTVFDLAVKYDGSDSGVFNLSQPVLATTPCNDAKFHLWETVVFSKTVRLFCDGTLVHTHLRTDSQKTWKHDDDSPFLVIGAQFSNTTSQYYSRCHMIVHDLRILTCVTES